MVEGESTRVEARRAILSVLADQKGWRSNEIVHQLKGGFAKGTVYRYRGELLRERLIEPKLGSEEEKCAARYFITQAGLKLLERMNVKDEIDGYLDEMPLDEVKLMLHQFRKRGTRLKFTETDENGKAKSRNPRITGETTKTIEGNAWIIDMKKPRKRHS